MSGLRIGDGNSVGSLKEERKRDFGHSVLCSGQRECRPRIVLYMNPSLPPGRPATDSEWGVSGIVGKERNGVQTEGMMDDDGGAENVGVECHLQLVERRLSSSDRWVFWRMSLRHEIVDIHLSSSD